MNARAAAELLYESEATLRMVDHALDELGIGDDRNTPRGPRLIAAGDPSEANVTDPDFAQALPLRVFWELQELLEQVGRSRKSLEQLRDRGAGDSEVDEASDLLGEFEARLSRLSRILGG